MTEGLKTVVSGAYWAATTPLPCPVALRVLCVTSRKEMEIDDKRYKYIYDPSDNGVEELPVGIRFVVSSAPTSMGD